MWLASELAFEIYDGGGFDCHLMIEALDIALIEIAPEFAIGDTVIGDAIAAGCDAAQSH